MKRRVDRSITNATFLAILLVPVSLLFGLVAVFVAMAIGAWP